ncbi:MAG: hypothetical protein WD872_04345 [Pirellulaceae bacterium]
MLVAIEQGVNLAGRFLQKGEPLTLVGQDRLGRVPGLPPVVGCDKAFFVG